MSQALEVNLLTAQLWKQGDIRDPLGVWGARRAVTGDASGGEIKVGITVLQAERAAYLYTCTAVNLGVVSAVGATSLNGICRLLSNWPNIDPQVGVQGFATQELRVIGIGGFTTAPQGGPITPFLGPNDRYILLFDPRPGIPSDLTIVELKLLVQVLADVYSFEAYGYYWDRSVLDAPGGPRHPGAS